MQTSKEVQTLDAVEAQVTNQQVAKNDLTLLEKAKQYKLEKPFNFWFLIVSFMLIIVLNSVFLSATQILAEEDLSLAPDFIQTLDKVRKATIAFMVFQLVFIPSIPLFNKMEIPYFVVNMCKLIIVAVGIPAAKDTLDLFDGVDADLEKDAETTFIMLILMLLFTIVQLVVGGFAIVKLLTN